MNDSLSLSYFQGSIVDSIHDFMMDFKNDSWLILKTLLAPKQLASFPQDFWQLLLDVIVHHLGCSTCLVDVGLYSIGPYYETLSLVSKHHVLRQKIQEIKEKNRIQVKCTKP